MALDLVGSASAACLLDRIEVATLAVGLANIDTLEHSAPMTHMVVDREDRAASGITDDCSFSVAVDAAGGIDTDLGKLSLGSCRSEMGV